MVVLHNAGGHDEGVIKAYGPYASANDIIMIWPTVEEAGWDTYGRVPGGFNTNHSI